jgi:tRNA A37 threonylcarbamoyladenosine dehydratase
MSTPNPVAHLKISLIKSAFRLIGCATVIIAGVDGVGSMAACFALAELLGIAEELV